MKCAFTISIPFYFLHSKHNMHFLFKYYKHLTTGTQDPGKKLYKGLCNGILNVNNSRVLQHIKLCEAKLTNQTMTCYVK